MMWRISSYLRPPGLRIFVSSDLEAWRHSQHVGCSLIYDSDKTLMGQASMDVKPTDGTSMDVTLKMGILNSLWFLPLCKGTRYFGKSPSPADPFLVVGEEMFS